MRRALQQHSRLENPMDRGACWATVHRVTKSQTQLKPLTHHTHTGMNTQTAKFKYIMIYIHSKQTKR